MDGRQRPTRLRLAMHRPTDQAAASDAVATSDPPSHGSGGRIGPVFAVTTSDPPSHGSGGRIGPVFALEFADGPAIATEIVLHWQMFHANAAVRVNVAKRTNWICLVRICLLLLVPLIRRPSPDFAVGRLRCKSNALEVPKPSTPLCKSTLVPSKNATNSEGKSTVFRRY